ncbi:MAG: hypothetical protein QOD10_716 [Mycobacterium sp.]|nr:hypothetical protein [Mycobacterium sp.]
MLAGYMPCNWRIRPRPHLREATCMRQPGVACLQREVSARESHGREDRIRAARFPARKSLEESAFEHARALNATPLPIWAPWTS